MTENINHKLGELIFNANILFLSISFGLFTFSVGSGKVSISNIYGFAIFTILVLIAGISSLCLSFFGIKNDKINLIYVAGVCFIILILLLMVAYSQIYINSVSQSVTLTSNIKEQ